MLTGLDEQLVNAIVRRLKPTKGDIKLIRLLVQANPYRLDCREIVGFLRAHPGAIVTHLSSRLQSIGWL